MHSFIRQSYPGKGKDTAKQADPFPALAGAHMPVLTAFTGSHWQGRAKRQGPEAEG